MLEVGITLCRKSQKRGEAKQRELIVWVGLEEHFQ